MGNLNYAAGTGDLKNWLITESRFDARYLGKCEAIFCQGNGYLGVRHALDEAYVGETRNTFVTGTFNKFDEKEVTELPNFPDITEMDLWFDGHRFSLETGELESYERTLNLYNGEVCRKVLWTNPEGKKLELCFRRFVSLDNEHLIGSRCEIRALTDELEVKLTSGINGRLGNSGSQHFEEGTARIYEGTYLESLQHTTQSRVLSAVYTTHNILLSDAGKVESLPIIRRRNVLYQYGFHLKAGEGVIIEKISGIYTTRDLKYRDMGSEEAENILPAESRANFMEAAKKGYEALFSESCRCWKKFWASSDIEIESKNDFDQLGIRFAQYHLNIMIKRKDDRVGIGAKALTGEGYKGHSFWDTEVFLFPYYLYTDPDAACTLLKYRYNGLYGARKKAAGNNCRGAQYPWEAAWIDDGEVTPLYGEADVVSGKAMPILTGLIEIHITADVAFAVNQYYLATKDQKFMDDYGYEIILDTARFWLSRIEWSEVNRRYEIRDVIGPDEYKEHVDNNAYTNYLAHYNIKLAKEYAATMAAERKEKYDELNRKLQIDEMISEIDEKLGLLYLPQPNEDGIIPQFDHYFDLKPLDLTKYKNSSVVGTIYHDYNMEQINEYQVSKQGDMVVLLFLLSDLFDEETKRKNYEYYETRTLHDSSLSKCTHGILANDLGLREDAYRFYQGSAQVDLGLEMKSSDAGIHSASMGGIWQSVVMGFGGLRLSGSALCINPKLPEEWNRLKFRVVWQRQPLEAEITKQEMLLTNMGTEAVELKADGQMVCLKSGTTRKILLKKE